MREPRALDPVEEQELQDFCLFMQRLANPLTKKDVLHYAWELDNMKKTPFFGDSGPTNGWWNHFINRHPTLSLHTPSTLDGGRVAMSRKSTMDKHFE